MKIIAKDNFNREYIPDFLVAENCGSFYAPIIAKLLNEYLGKNPNHHHFYITVENDYKLYKFEP